MCGRQCWKHLTGSPGSHANAKLLLKPSLWRSSSLAFLNTHDLGKHAQISTKKKHNFKNTTAYYQYKQQRKDMKQICLQVHAIHICRLLSVHISILFSGLKLQGTAFWTSAERVEVWEVAPSCATKLYSERTPFQSPTLSFQQRTKYHAQASSPLLMTVHGSVFGNRDVRCTSNDSNPSHPLCTVRIVRIDLDLQNDALPLVLPCLGWTPSKSMAWQWSLNDMSVITKVAEKVMSNGKTRKTHDGRQTLFLSQTVRQSRYFILTHGWRMTC